MDCYVIMHSRHRLSPVHLEKMSADVVYLVVTSDKLETKKILLTHVQHVKRDI